MNTPNKLTVARIIATPIFMFTMLFNFKGHFAISLILFALASITDYIDGKMARKLNIVTDFGKFLDPLADKMLTTAAFIGFMANNIGYGMPIVLFIVLFREFLVSSLRLVTVSSKGKVVAANIWGKLKTATQMFGIVLGLLTAALNELLTLGNLYNVMNVATNILIWSSTVLCAISGVIYLVQCKDSIDPRK